MNQTLVSLWIFLVKLEVSAMLGIEKTQGLRRTYIHYILILLISLGFVTVAVVQVSITATTALYKDHLEKILQQSLNSLTYQNRTQALNQGNLQEWIHNAMKDTSVRLTLIDWDGTALADSQANPSQMDNHRYRPEIQDAYFKGSGDSIRYSNTLELDLLYVARRVSLELSNSEFPNKILRVATPLSGVISARNATIRAILLISIPTLLLSLGLTYLEIRRISRPVRQIIAAAEEYQKGNLKVPLSILRPWEFSQIAWAMKSMATDLIQSLQQARDQRDEINTLLQAIQEPVILVDKMQRILQLNRTAEILISKPQIPSHGVQLLTLIRNSELSSLLDRAIRINTPQLDTVYFFSGEERWYICRIIPIPLHNEEFQYLIMLYDETERRALEQQRREFITNAAHELRSPLTVLRGYVEELAEGSDKVDIQEYAPLLLNHTKRLEDTIDNLFLLTRVWQNPRGSENVEVDSIIEQVIQKLSQDAAKRGIRISTTVDANHPGSSVINANQELIELALSHLIRNAIEASTSGDTITVWTEESENEIQIIVLDEGAGIDPIHQVNIFNEFYRAPKDRPRYSGSGVGLTLVREIIAIHGGRVSVHSQVGQGSQFTIHIPLDRKRGR